MISVTIFLLHIIKIYFPIPFAGLCISHENPKIYLYSLHLFYWYLPKNVWLRKTSIKRQ